MPKISNKFNWGQVIHDYEIGPYVIRAYHPRQVRGNEVTREIDEDRIEYHGYIDGKDTSESWGTLEDAMAGLIVRRILGLNAGNINYHFVAGLRAMAEDK